MKAESLTQAAIDLESAEILSGREILAIHRHLAAGARCYCTFRLFSY